ncbi:ROK family transcriptional regulator [Rhizobium sp.]|jgi:predicted NBD/HSP70 family sugar kinase|uniref:ROK family transcriptional regulator n=1 Tax=Rhizobium sp. TaxID=391 RepID=UPI000E99456A|nr:transcriptional regulator [Rhizobium sp.]
MLKKSSSDQVRRQNSTLVLDALRRQPALSHTDLSGLTGLASATVTAITNDLEQAGMIERHEQQHAATRGRPRVLLSRRRSFAAVISVQISSDNVRYALSDYRGLLMDRFDERRPLHATPEHFLEDFARALLRLIDRSKLQSTAVAALSISSKGLVDPEGRRLIWSPVFGNLPIDFSGILSIVPQAQLMISNETLLVAHGLVEHMAGKGGNFNGLIALSLGHSIGLGIARTLPNGGVEVRAPNFGHMLHVADPKLCRCGSRGCVEASAGFYGILRTAFEVPPDTIPARFVPIAEMDRIAQSARTGNRMAQYAFRQAGLALGQGLSRVFSLFETMPVIVTGPGTRYYDLIQRGLEEGLGQSLQARLDGLPRIDIVSDEATLVYEGHLDRALQAIDQQVFVGDG